MTFLIIVLCVLLFILFLLSFSITLKIKLDDNANVWFCFMFLKFKIYPLKNKKDKDKKKKTKLKKKASEKIKNQGEKQDKKQKEKPDFKETVLLIIDVIKSAVKPIKNLFKHIRITDVKINMAVGGDDAYDTTITYGKTITAINAGIAFLKNLINVKVSYINVFCDYNINHTKQDISFKIKLRGFIIIFAGLCIIYNILVNTFKRNKKIKQGGAENE